MLLSDYRQGLSNLKMANMPLLVGEGDLRLYDLQNSSTASPIMCGEQFCNIVAKYDKTDCNSKDRCPYGVSYGDGSKTAGYLATDDFYLNTVVANLKTQLAKIAIHFGCGNHQSNSLQVTNGLLGLGRADTSFISQLASAGKSPKAFAHCLDGNTLGGILVVGHVVEPSIKMIPLVPHETFYLVKLEGINIAGVFIKSTGKQEVIIDSGTTLALLPKDYSKSLISMIMAIKGVIELPKGEQELDKCFLYNGSVNHAFPTISFLFEGSTSITINPSDYIFSISENTWCVGWQSIPHSNSKRDRIILGDSVLKNKLFVFDLEKQQIGWKDHDCFSSITIRDDKNGNMTVASHIVEHQLAPFLSKGLTNTNAKNKITFIILFLIIAILHS